MLTIASIDRLDTVNIPNGNPSITIWFSGCSIKCDKCHNPKLQDKNNGEEYDPISVVGIIAGSIGRTGINDVVLLGGEPLDQDWNDLEELCKCLRMGGVQIHLYTGYEMKDIPEDIRDMCCWIKTGRYIEKLKSNDGLASSNQRVWTKTNNIWRATA